MAKTLGNRIQELRKERKMTQEELAEKLDVTPQAVSKWETDNSYPDISLLVELANLFNCTVDELLGRKNNETKVLPEDMRKDINKMLLKIRITSEENEKTKVNINLPVALILACYDEGKKIPVIEEKLNGMNIDLGQIIMLISNGVVGNLIEIETDGNFIQIFVE